MRNLTLSEALELRKHTKKWADPNKHIRDTFDILGDLLSSSNREYQDSCFVELLKIYISMFDDDKALTEKYLRYELAYKHNIYEWVFLLMENMKSLYFAGSIAERNKRLCRIVGLIYLTLSKDYSFSEILKMVGVEECEIYIS